MTLHVSLAVADAILTLLMTGRPNQHRRSRPNGARAYSDSESDAYWHSVARLYAEAYPQTNTCVLHIAEHYYMQIDECIGTISVLAQRALELCGDTDSPLVIDDGNNRGHGSVANERDICLLQHPPPPSENPVSAPGRGILRTVSPIVLYRNIKDPKDLHEQARSQPSRGRVVRWLPKS